MDETVTADRKDGSPLLVVGLGASAGGLDALQAFFAAMPDDSDLAFVVITHQAPNRSSLMPELLGRTTDMPVTQISTPTRILPNHIYTARPGFNLRITNGVVHPVEVSHPPATMAVDVFFRSLAHDQKERAVGIILSGTGSDGSLGLKEIKAGLGMVMAQDQQTAQFDGMPQSAIATELVDHVLSPPELADQLDAYAELRRSGVPTRTSEVSAESLQPFFDLVRDRTGHDFSRYKQNTMRRRIERRMSVHHLDSLERYARYLHNRPAEVDLLFGDLLIGVTSFFRDPETWEGLAPALRELVASKPDDYVVRAWVPGCSTGEEAYSLAILLDETIAKLERRIDVQIYATDIDGAAIETARSGRYPIGIAGDVSSARLAQFFTRDMDLYRVRKEIREMVVFAPHDLIGDPPFTKLDILSCRNLLIYLDGDLQERVVPIFHYALKPDGLLFLGTSESLGTWTKLFSAVDKEKKIFRRAEVPAGTYSTDLPATPSYPVAAAEKRAASPARARRGASLEQAVQQLLVDKLVPPTVLLHERGDLIHVHGKTGLFLQPAEGSQSNPNIFDMARQGLQISLASALREAATSGRETVRRDVQVKTDGDEYTVDLRVRPVDDQESFKDMFLVTFERGRPSERAAETEVDEATRISDLERALLHARESHQGTIRELELANQDLKSANEELQSTNEEIGTSKEEMQSLNEELQTVNSELQGKVDELSHATDDMANLLNSTDIATLFLDGDLRIKRFTERARRVIRVIPSDIGRSIGDLVSTLHYDGLMADAREVLRTLVAKEIEVRSEAGQSYLMRILPYRTTENVIDGLVITFVEVTKIQRLQEEQQRLLEALRSSPASIWAQDTDLRISWACSPLFGKESAEVTGKSDRDLFEPSDADRLTAIKMSVLESGNPQRQRLDLSMNGERRTYHLYVEPNRDSGGEITGVSCVAVDVTWSDESGAGDGKYR